MLQLRCVALLGLCLACEGSPRAPAVEEERGVGSTAADAALDSMSDPIENAAACPEAEPTPDGRCPSAGIICKYGEDPDCRSRWTCGEDRRWSLDYAMRDCGEGCPSSEPEPGDDCAIDRLQCTFGEGPACRSLWMCWQGEWAEIVEKRDCDADVYCPATQPDPLDPCSPEEATPFGGLCLYEGGTQCVCSCSWGPPGEGESEAQANWYCKVASAEYDPVYLTSCPLVPPEEGDECESESTCGYVSPDECEARGAGTEMALCIAGAWVLTTEP